MAASVLGKRSRRACGQEEPEVASPSKKRQTRRTPLQIHEDASQTSQCDLPTVTNRTRTSKRNGRNDQTIPSKQTASIPEVDEAAKENQHPTFATPSHSRFRDALSISLPSTPRHRVKLAGKLATPRSHRTATTPRTQSVFAIARQLFTQSASPSKLVGRTTERQRLQTFINDAFNSKKGGCTYVSGPPGTGKSALVQQLFQSLNHVSGLKTSIINCVSCRTADRVLGQLKVDLDIQFGSTQKSNANAFTKSVDTKQKNTMHLVLLDEIDSLVDHDCEFLYSIFEWSMQPASSLILIGIANALDLTDRFLPRLKARGLKPRLLPFLSYTAKEMSDIISEKLRSVLPADTTTAPDFVPFVHPAAIQLIGKKIASQTGDLRKAFNLVRRTIDQVEQETMQKLLGPNTTSSPSKTPLSVISNMSSQLPPSPPSSSPFKPATSDSPTITTAPQLTVETAPRASIAHVAKLASSIFNNGTVSRLSGLNLQQKAVLCSLVANEKKRSERDPYKTPSKSSARVLSVKDLFERYARLCQRDEGLLHPLKNTEFRDVIASLETLGLVHESMSRTSSLLTPSKTPSRGRRNPDERQLVSAVSEREMRGSLTGAGGDLLQRLLDE